MQRKNENNVSKECILTPFEMAEIFLITFELQKNENNVSTLKHAF